MEIIAFDSHKHYTSARVEQQNGQLLKEQRINRYRDNISGFLAKYERGSSVAVETIGQFE